MQHSQTPMDWISSHPKFQGQMVLANVSQCVSRKLLHHAQQCKGRLWGALPSQIPFNHRGCKVSLVPIVNLLNYLNCSLPRLSPNCVLRTHCIVFLWTQLHSGSRPWAAYCARTLLCAVWSTWYNSIVINTVPCFHCRCNWRIIKLNNSCARLLNWKDIRTAIVGSLFRTQIICAFKPFRTLSKSLLKKVCTENSPSDCDDCRMPHCLIQDEGHHIIVHRHCRRPFLSEIVFSGISLLIRSFIFVDLFHCEVSVLIDLEFEEFALRAFLLCTVRGLLFIQSLCFLLLVQLFIQCIVESWIAQQEIGQPLIKPIVAWHLNPILGHPCDDLQTQIVTEVLQWFHSSQSQSLCEITAWNALFSFISTNFSTCNGMRKTHMNPAFQFYSLLRIRGLNLFKRRIATDCFSSSDRW